MRVVEATNSRIILTKFEYIGIIRQKSLKSLFIMTEEIKEGTEYITMKYTQKIIKFEKDPISKTEKL